MFLSQRERSRYTNCVSLFAVLHESSDIHRRTDIGIDRTSQQLKGVPVKRAKLELSRSLVRCFVDTWMQHCVIETNLARHAGCHLTFALQQYGFNVVNEEPALRVVREEGLNVDTIQRFPFEHGSIAVHEDVRVFLDVDENFVDSVGHAPLPSDRKLA